MWWLRFGGRFEYSFGGRFVHAFRGRFASGFNRRFDIVLSSIWRFPSWLGSLLFGSCLTLLCGIFANFLSLQRYVTKINYVIKSTSQFGACLSIESTKKVLGIYVFFCSKFSPLFPINCNKLNYSYQLFLTTFSQNNHLKFINKWRSLNIEKILNVAYLNGSWKSSVLSISIILHIFLYQYCEKYNINK